VSICYNIGVSAFKGSTLLRRVNAYGIEAGIRQAFLMWRKPIELLARRKREADLYFS
jgi:GH24 family phage-related lysozyme (muramidase)